MVEIVHRSLSKELAFSYLSTKMYCGQPGQKGSRCQAREEFARVGVLEQYVGASDSSATVLIAVYKAGYWQTGLFQQDANL